LAGIHGVSQIFTGTHLPARCAPLGPLTAPLAPVSFVYVMCLFVCAGFIIGLCTVKSEGSQEL